ncbi:MAG TPA: NTF2 fold immunity protein [Solimonas sp.]
MSMPLPLRSTRPVLMALTLALFASLSLAQPGHAASPQRAPAWTLKTPDGTTVSYPKDAQGQPTVLLFWPSWCPYSRALQPYVQDLWIDYRDAGVKVWTINIMENGDPLQAMRERGLSFPLLLNGDDLIASYGITRTPWFLVIDSQRRIVYTRPADVPSPVDVAKAAREALNRLLGARAVPLPATYPPPYDLHLRKPGPSRLESDAAPDTAWQPWAAQYLAAVRPDERVDGIVARGPVSDGKTAIARARELWAQAYGPEAARSQAPFRAYRRNDLWLVAGKAYADTLGQGFVLVVHADTGRVLRLRGGGTVAPP